MKNIFAVVFLLLLSTMSIEVQAQPFFTRAIQLPTESNTFVHSDGTIFQTGAFIDSPDFDLDGEPDFESLGGSDIYISSHTPDGVLNWVMVAGGTTASEVINETGGGIVVGDGKLYVAGTFDEGADFDSDGMDDITAVEPATSGLFIAQYELDGTFNWVKPIGELDGFVSNLVFSSSNQTLYLSGTKLDEAGNTDGTGIMYIAALDLDGVAQWTSPTSVDGTPTTGNVEAYDLIVDTQGLLYLSGAFRGDVDFDGDGPLEPVSTGTTQFGPQARAFIAQYSASGVINWIDYASGTGSSFANGLALDTMDNLYVTGSYGLGNVVFENSESTFTGPEPADNMFLTKYGSDGAVLWAVFPNALVDFFIFSAVYGNDVAVSLDDTTIMVGGYLTGSVDFDGNNLYEINTFSFPAFTVAYSTEGNAIWNWTAGTDASVQHVLSTHPETFSILGDFTTSIDFDGSGAEEPMVDFDGTGRGFFLADFSLVDTTIPVELTSFSATADGNEVLLAWETASEINNAGFAILHNNEEVAFVTGAGSTNEPQSHNHTIDYLSPGTHTFQLKQIDFDGSFSMSESAVVDINLDELFVLSRAFPNPFNPQSTFTLTVAQDQEVSIALFDMLGRQVQTLYQGQLQANRAHNFTIDGSQLPSGTYIYRVTGSRFHTSERVILLK